jgi:hypothetical protein
MLFKSYLAERRAKRDGVKLPVSEGPPKSVASGWTQRQLEQLRKERRLRLRGSRPDWGGSVV